MKKKKGFAHRWEKDENFRYRATYFIAVVVVVGVILGTVASIDPQIPMLQRTIAYQTADVLNIFGVEAKVFDYWVEVHTPSLSADEYKEIQITFAKLTLVLKSTDTKLIGYNNYLTRAEEDALFAYMDSLKSRGIQVKFEPATIVTPNVAVNIIPGCTAWLGIAAITALILAYPGSTKKKKLFGLVIAWATMHVVNILRLFSTIAATNWFGTWVWAVLEPLIWRWGMVAVALMVWVVWLKYIAEEVK